MRYRGFDRQHRFIGVDERGRSASATILSIAAAVYPRFNSALVRDFSQRLRGADVALFFYAGRGLQMNSRNYLLPVDVKIENPADVRFNTINCRYGDASAFPHALLGAKSSLSAS